MRGVRGITILACLLVLSVPALSGCNDQPEVRWVIDIRDHCKTEFCRDLLRSVARALDGKVYSSTTDSEIFQLAGNDSENTVQKIGNYPKHKFVIESKALLPISDSWRDNRVLVFWSQGVDFYAADVLFFMSEKNGKGMRLLRNPSFVCDKRSSKAEIELRLIQFITKGTFL
jgi:hypothetical protein